MIEIPLSNQPEQLFSIVLNDVLYNCRVILNTRSSTWSFSLSKGSEKVIDGITLLSGINILKQYNLPLKSIFVVNIDNPKSDPTPLNLGISSRVYLLESAQ